MEIEKILTFVRVAEARSFTKAAENLYLTQATVTKHIQSLERSWNVKLFIRDRHHSVELTRIGGMILDSAKNIVQNYYDIGNTIQIEQNKGESYLRIGTIPTISNYKAFSAITEYQLNNFDVHLRIQEMESKKLFPSLESGKSDLIFLRTFGDEGKGLETIDIEKDHFVAIMPMKHPLAQNDQIEFNQLAKENILVLGKATHMYEPFMELVKLANFQPQVVYDGERIDLILDLVNSGMGIGVLMAKSVDLTNYPNLVKVSLREQVSSQLIFARKRGNHTAVSNQMWSFLKDKFSES